MSFYSNVYYKLCESRKTQKINYKKGSDLHRHHIKPTHSGGTDEDSNLTYLTIEEHRISHFLLWKIGGQINDLRSMNMLGANLSHHYRHLIGKWCFENKIGIYSDKIDKKEKWKWRRKGIEKQIELKIGIHNPENFVKYATIGAKASIRSPNNPWHYWASPEGRRERASLGGKTNIDKKAMYKPGDKTFTRVRKEDILEYQNKGYILGSPIPNKFKGKKTNQISPRRRKVTDGVTIYNSVHDAAEKNNLTPGAIVYRCKSKKSTWDYVS
tara:strand:- start:303 stop:1109 length:807 start_codon:yes stop_codon:yes gene_type:complete